MYRLFSLIELLIIVSILLILSSLMLSSFERINKLSNLTGCINNQKNIQLAINTYSNDNDDLFPHCNWLTIDIRTNAPGWLYNHNGRDKSNISKEHLRNGSIYEYLNEKNVYRCPGDESLSRLGTNRITSYLMHGVVNKYGRSLKPLKIFNLDSKTMLLFEPGVEASYILWNDGSSLPHETGGTLPYRHDFRSVLSFVDGSSRLVENEAYLDMLNRRSEVLYPEF